MYLSDKKFYTFIGAGAIIASLVLINFSFSNDLKRLAKPGVPKDNKFGIVAGESIDCDTEIITLETGESIGSYAIYNNKVVYHKNLTDGTYGIYSYDLTTGVETLIIDNASNPEYSEPSIYDNKIVLEGYIPYYNLYLYQSGNISQLTTTTSRKSDPYIHNDKIVYRDWSYGMNLFDITTGETTNIDTGGNTYGSFPKMYGNYVVWHKYENNTHITVLHDISTGVTTNIKEGDGGAKFPDVYNNYIAYYKEDSQDDTRWLVAIYNILNGQETIIPDPNPDSTYPFHTTRHGYPLTFDNNYVAWSYRIYGGMPSFWGLKAYNIQTQQEYVVASEEGVQKYSPKIHGNNIIYLAYDQLEHIYSLRSYSLDCLSSPSVCTADERQVCGSYTTGICQTGYKTCGYNNTWGECQGNIDPADEICEDSIDNDCDGSTDEEDCTDTEDENEGICPVKYIKIDYGRYSFDHGGGSRVYEIDALDADDVDWADYSQGTTVEVSSINTGYASEGQYNFDARDIIDGQFGSTETGTFTFDYYDNDQWAKITLPEEKEIQTITTSQIAYDLDREVWENIIIQTSIDGTNWITWYENLDAYNTPTSVEASNPNNCGVGTPDFIISDMYIEQEDGGGDNYYLYITVENIGEEITDSTLSILVEDENTGDIYTASITDTFTSGYINDVIADPVIREPADNYHLNATVDDDDSFDESNEDNNTYYEKIKIRDNDNSGGGSGGSSNQSTNNDDEEDIDDEEDTATTTDDIIEDDTATTTDEVIEEDEDVNDEPVNNSLPGYGSSNGGSSDTTTYIIIKDKRKGIEIKVKTEEQEIIDEEKGLVEQVDKTITSKYAGRIILPEDMDEIWYVEPISEQKFYLNDGNSAYNVMQIFGLGISNDDLAKIPIGILDEADIVDSDGDGLDDKLEESLGTDMFNPDTDNDGYLDGTEVKYSYHPKAIGKFPYEFDFGEHLAGKILIQVESRGEAWYLNPDDGKRYYLKDGYTAYQLLNMLSSQVSTDELRSIDVGEF